MGNFELANRIKMLKKYSNVDALYGPYESLEDVFTSIPESLRLVGLTVGILDVDEGIVEYLWKTGILDSLLVQKVEKLILTLSSENTELNFQENESVILLFNVEGRAAIQKGFVYRVSGTSEIFVKEFSNIGKGSNSITLTDINTSGIYKYRIKVVDSSGIFAKCGEDEYIEYNIKYGGVSVSYNFSKLNAIQIKNIYSVAELEFNCIINVRDNSFNVTGMFLSDNNSINIPLTPKNAIKEDVDSYLGYKYYYLPDENTLSSLNGKACFIIIKYTENGVENSHITSLFTLLDITSLELISLTEPKNYQAGIESYFTFKLLSGVSNISVVLNPQENSDFNFIQGTTVATYKNFSLKILPKLVKDNAIIRMNYSFTYDNNNYTGTFELNLGNIVEYMNQDLYEPTLVNVSRGDIIFADNNNYDISEEGVFYKIISEPLTEEYISNACLLDIYCKIPKLSDRNTRFLEIKYGNSVIGYINGNEINCRGFTSDTPVGEWVQIGLGYNLEELIIRNNDTVSALYYAIYINGMIVKNRQTSQITPIQYNPSYKFSVTLLNEIQVQKCVLYYKNDGAGTLSPNDNADLSIIYRNYLIHTDFTEPADLPILKLMKITNSTENENYFNLINTYKDSIGGDPIVHTTIFGEIGATKATRIEEYDTLSDSNIEHRNATLFRLHVNIKKPAQKDYAVLCRGEYRRNSINILEGVIVEVHTQGTSTLRYSIPNFRFTFWRDNGNSVEPFYPEFLVKETIEGNPTYYHEYIYTAKIDYMDSSHLNNTPTCTYYNNLILTLIENNEITGSPSAREGNLDAIKGSPIILEISDLAANFNDIFTNVGSFMLNIDKTGETLGFEAGGLSCLSLEGTSNDEDSGGSGRFILPNGLKEYFDYEHNTVDEAEITNDFNTAKTSIKTLSINDALELLPYVQWCYFLANGLEYRYPDGDIYKEKDGHVSKIFPLDDFLKTYKMWAWVAHSSLEEDSVKYKQEFVTHFDLDYCILYFILLMVFGQTDNLGKNCMFDTWDGDIWYPRPYDLDSLTGLDNNGSDEVAPFVEIRPEFSLNYNLYKNNLLDLIDNYLTLDALLPYGSLLLLRYHYSSSNSNLWVNFFKHFRDEINTFYVNLRDNYNYTPESVIELCLNQLINVLGTNLYNKDFRNKYLANSAEDLMLAYGNRWNKFKKWINQRFAFCDSYFGKTAAYYCFVNSRFTYNISVDSPLYITQYYLSNNEQITKFVVDTAEFTMGTNAAVGYTLFANLGEILTTNLFKYITNSDGNSPKNFTGLLSLDMSGNLSTRFSNISELVGTNLPNLQSLNVSNIPNLLSIDVPFFTKILMAQRLPNLSSITFLTNGLIEEINLSGSTISGDIDFSNLPKLRTVDLTGCIFNGNVTFAYLESLENLILSNTLFNGQVSISEGVKVREFDFSQLTLHDITFSGTDLNIETLNFNRTIFGVNSININAIVTNIKNLYFNNCTGLTLLQITLNKTFSNLKKFSLTNSSIKSLGNNSTCFNAQYFTNPATLEKVVFNDSGVLTTTALFNFENTVIEDIQNLLWNGSGEKLFNNCIYLTSITGSLHLTDSISYLFNRCEVLTAVPNTIEIDNTLEHKVTSASYALAGTSSLNYSVSKNIIKSCVNVSDFSFLYWCKQFDLNQIINLTELFGNNLGNILNFNYAFCSSPFSNSNYNTYTNKLIIEGKFPAATDSLYRTFAYTNKLTIPYNIILSCSSLTDLTATFAWCGNGLTFTEGDYERELPGSDYKTIDKYFFPHNVTILNYTFLDTIINLADDDIFTNLVNLNKCVGCFAYKSNRLFTNDINVVNFWSNCSSILDISACFYGVTNVSCSNSLNLASSNKVKIDGLFGLPTADYTNTISFNFNTIASKISSMGSYYVYGSGDAAYRLGTFLGRKVIILDSEDVLKTINVNCYSAFRNSHLYLQDSVTELDLTNITVCNYMFYGCSTYSVTLLNTRKYLTIKMPINCANYNYMFASSLMLLELPELRSSNTLYLAYTFAGSIASGSPNIVINSDIIVPYDYFLICKNTLRSTQGMFRNNSFVSELEYNENKGLFSECSKVTTTAEMFMLCKYLCKGIPNNFFGTTTLNILNMSHMFRETAIFYDIENGGNKWIAQTTFSPLVNVTDISYLFYLTRVQAPGGLVCKTVVTDLSGIDIPVIHPEAFMNMASLLKIDYMFNFAFASNTLYTGSIKFPRFVNGYRAFYDCNIRGIDSQFVPDLRLPNITNVEQMFYQTLSGRTIDNLGLFITKLSNNNQTVRKANMAGNLSNTDISGDYASLKDPIASETSTTGFTRSKPSTT